MFEYISPTFEVNIGQFSFRKVKDFRVFSSRINPIDRAEIDLDTEETPTSSIAKDQPVEIWQGYREKGLWDIFSGTVQDVSPARIVTVYCKDAMEKLRKTKITQSFRNVRPQEIVNYALGKAGMTRAVICSRSLPQKHSFIVSGKNGIETLKLVNQSWGLDDWRFYTEPDGEFYWGPWEESKRYQQGEIVTLEYGKSLLELTPSDEETGTLTTIALPFVRHSELIRIIDGRFWDREVTARVERITYLHGSKARTRIEWRILKSF